MYVVSRAMPTTLATTPKTEADTAMAVKVELCLELDDEKEAELVELAVSAERTDLFPPAMLAAAISSGTDRGAMSSLGELGENTACLTFLMGSVSSSPASTQCHQLTHS